MSITAIITATTAPTAADLARAAVSAQATTTLTALAQQDYQAFMERVSGATDLCQQAAYRLLDLAETHRSDWQLKGALERASDEAYGIATALIVNPRLAGAIDASGRLATLVAAVDPIGVADVPAALLNEALALFS